MSSLCFEMKIWLSLVGLMYTIGILKFYGYLKFTSIAHLIIVNKRYPSIVISEAIISMIYLLISLPLWTNNRLNATQITQTNNQTLNQFFICSGYISTSFCTHYVVNAEAVRPWLMSFDLNYLKSSKNEQWKSQIDSKFAEKDWYLLNRITYGNKRFIMIRVCAYYLFCAVSSSLIFIFFGPSHFHLAQFVDGVFFSLPVFVTLYCYYTVPKDLNDQFLFHYEFRTTATIFATGLIWYFLNQIVAFFGYLTINTILTALLGVFSIACPSLISILWIPRKILSNHMWSQQQQHFRKQSADIILHEIQMGTKHKNENVSIEKKLLNALRRERKFESFISWMYREFSSETILCFVELIQFKQRIVAYSCIY